MIRKTLDTDIPAVMAIYDAARAFMRAHGNATQWPEGTPSAEQLAADIAAGGSYVYLDPMFPERTKSAAVKKKFQLLHHLEQPCTDEESLVEAALAVHPRKVVIKRPVKGPLLAGVKPSYQLAGKAVRYDVLVPPRP